MKSVVVVDALRTPLGKRNGYLAGMHPVDLGADVLNGLVQRNQLDPALVDDVIWGCVSQVADQSSNVGRWSVLAAGWPESVPGTTVDRACGSSMQAIASAAAGIAAGHYDVVVAGGVESMSRVPMGSSRAVGGQPRGPRVAERYGNPDFSQGTAAEMVAAKWGLTRSQSDQFALTSHARAVAATEAGWFDREMLRLVDPDTGEVITRDQGIRAGGTLESLGGLKPAFSADGTVTAGNASQISDGAAALLLMSEEKAADLGMEPLARFVSFSVVGMNPVLMLTGPIDATAKVLDRAGLGIDDIDAFEINEAFAPVALSWLAETRADPKKLNPCGGAIALGHPLGGSGARLATTMIHHLKRTGQRYGLQSMCEAGGMANAFIVESL